MGRLLSVFSVFSVLSASPVFWLLPLLGVASAAALPGRALADDGELAFVHVEANVGGASGGHSALRLGDRVYHFEVGAEHLLQLERVDWEVFRFRYNVLQNRPLELAYLDVDARTRRRLEDRFTALLLRQQDERAELAERERDAALLEASLGLRAGVPTPAAGLFDPGAPPPPGARSLAERLAAAAAAAGDELPRAIGAAPGGAQRYREALALRFAVRMLREARPLDRDAWLAAGGPALDPGERASLEALQGRLEDVLARLLRDRARPDRARALLVALARHRAVQRSLASGRLYLVDPFPARAPGLDAREARRRRPELLAIAGILDERVARERRLHLSGAAPREPDLARLEALAARAREYRRGALEGRPVREPGDVLVPGRSRDLPVPAPPPPAAAARLAVLRQQQRALAAERRERWHYALFGWGGENCVTELGHTVNAALDDPRAALGGRLDPDAWLRFWPLVFFHDVEAKLAVSRVETLPAYRVRLRAALGRHNGRLVTRLRESNTLTSTLYTPRDPDGSFLFFTDDAALARPLLGALNLAWAAGDGLVGIVAAPFDRGERLARAGKGVLFSLPELLFVNIRKGTFDAATLPVSPGAD